MPHHGEHRPINRLRDIIPVATVFGVNPANLERCTDGDWAARTGLGTGLLLGAGYYGQLDFDMGVVYNVELRAKLQVGTDLVAGDLVSCFVEFSEDDITYIPAPGVGTYWYSWWLANTDEDIFAGSRFGRGRYIRLQFHGAAAATWRLAVYEIQAVDHHL